MAEAAKLQFLADVTSIESALKTIDKLGDTATAAELKAAGLDEAISTMGKDGAGIKQAITGLDSLISSIDPTISKFNQLDNAAKELQSAFSKGIISSEVFSDTSRMLDLQRDKVQQQRDELTGYAAEQRAAAQAASDAAKKEEQAAAQAAKEQAQAAKEQAAAEAAALKQQQQAAAQAAREQAAAQAAAEAAAAKEAAAIQRLTDALTPGAAAARRITEQMELLERALASGAVSSEQYEVLSGKLNQAAESARKLAENGNQAHHSMGHMSQDISYLVSSIAMGVNPLEAFVEQLPYFATAFGGVGQTMKVFAGMLTPFNVGITAVVGTIGVLAYQAYEAHENIVKMTQSLAMAGNQSGQTASDLVRYADALAKSSGASEDVVNLAVQSAAAVSKTGDEMKQLASTAVTISQQTGEATDTLVKKLSALAGDPVQALQQLGEQYGFLNPQIVEQVQQMVNAGDKTGAYEAVLAALNDRMSDFSKSQQQYFKDVNSWWDILIGKSEAYLNWQDKIKSREGAAQSSGSQFITTGAGGTNSFITGQSSGYTPLKDQAQQTQNDIQAGQAAEDVNRRLQTALPQSSRTLLQIKQTLRDINILQKNGGTAQQISDAQKLLGLQQKSYQTELASEQKRAQPKPPKATQADAGQSMLAQYTQENLTLQEQIKFIQDRGINQKNQSEQELRYVQLQSQFEVLGRQKNLTLQDKQKLAVEDQVLAQARLLALNGQELQRLKQQAEITDQIAANRAKVTAVVMADNASAGESTRTRQREIRDLQQIADLKAKGATPAQIADQLGVNNTQDQHEDEQRTDYISGMKTGLRDWADSATDYSKIAANAVSSAMDTGAQAVSNFVLTGKGNFADFTKSILSMLTQILTKILLLKAVEATASAAGFGLPGLTANAKGGVYNSPSLSNYSNGVYSTPQTFSFGAPQAFAKGGVFAEAGPEAIMPLTRDSNGRLGVRSDSAGGGSSNHVETNVYIDGNGNATTDKTSNSTAGAKLGDVINQSVIQVINQQSQAGGILAQKFVSK